MKKLILSSILMLGSINTFALDCSVKTQSANGNYDQLVTNVVNVQDKDLIVVLRDGSVHRQKNIDIGSEALFTLNKNQFSTYEGSKIISFGTGSSNVIVTAKHISGTQTDFKSLSATAFASSSPYGILLDYTNKFMISCL
jgi:hypothetical protein